jgi:hypothetical protein
MSSCRFLLAMSFPATATALLVADKIILPKLGASCPSGFRRDGVDCVQSAKLPCTHDSRNAYVDKIEKSCPSGYRTDGSGYGIRSAR